MENKDLEPQKPLLLRANRALGTAFVEHKLVTSAQLEAANAKLMELIKTGELKQASLLNLLLMGAEEIKESALINYQSETLEIGLIDLTNYNLERSFDFNTELAACWASRTIPYDKQEEFVFLATNFYLSEPVRKYWEEIYKGSELVWSVISSTALIEALERIEAKLKKSS